MDKSEATTLVQRVINRLGSDERRIDSETYIYLMDLVSESIQDDSGGLADTLLTLKDYVYAAWAYDHVSKLEGFDVGACWGLMKAHDMLARDRNQKFDQE